MNKNLKVLYPTLLAIAVAAGVLLGTKIQRRMTPTSTQAVNFFQPDKISLLLKLIQKDYVDSVDNSAIVEKVIPDMLKELDPHTTYLPAEDMKTVNEEMRGNFSGIGVQFRMQKDTVMIIDVVSGGPSKKLGIQAGDRIIKVDGKDIAGVKLPSDSIVSMLRGRKGTIVNVTVYRPGFADLFNFDIERGEIPIFSVDIAYMITPKIGLIKVNRFAESTYEEFVNAIDTLKEKGAEKLIVDLRENSGGSLSAVINMVDEFLPTNQLIVYTEGKARARDDYFSTDRGSWEDKQVAVLINEFSASASEIFAGAIQDNDRGIIIGRRSYGKGLVQEQIPFYDGSALRLTVARFYTPSGRCIQKSYEDGIEAYQMDFHNRLMHDELNEKDSIHFDNKLKYYTKAGRTVYGGGGIMPDFFIPVDTTGINALYSAILSKNMVMQFAFNYADSNRPVLKQLGETNAIVDYLNTQGVFNQFMQQVREKGISYSSVEFTESKTLLKTQLNALICQYILGDDAFYPVIFKIDQTVNKAVELLQQNWTTAEISKIEETVELN